jgi:hypothetical protein
MRWKFWSRREKASKNLPPVVKENPWQEAGAMERMFVQSFCRSAKDVLGLQQLVGNQVLLQAFAPEKSNGSAENRESFDKGSQSS